MRDNIPLKLPNLKINNTNITRETSIKFLGVLIHLSRNYVTDTKNSLCVF